MNGLQTHLIAPDSDGIDRAARLLDAGGLVAFPTETVYGLGADARNNRAVAAIFNAKNRPHFNPLIVHVATIRQARELAEFNDAAERLAAAFWPGPMTLVLPLQPTGGLADLVTAGLQTVAIRIPAHPLAQDLLAHFGGPLAAPSANPSGRISPTTAAHVMGGLSGRISGILDGGDCSVGLESTIIGLIDEPILLRPGGLPVEAIEDCLGQPLATGGDADAPSAPGQLASHYAPQASVRLNATSAREGETMLGFGHIKGDLNLSESGDLVEAAGNLFGALHELDRQSAVKIAVAPIPERGLGRAINDRLRRAAAPRD